MLLFLMSFLSAANSEPTHLNSHLRVVIDNYFSGASTNNLPLTLDQHPEAMRYARKQYLKHPRYSGFLAVIQAYVSGFPQSPVSTGIGEITCY